MLPRRLLPLLIALAASPVLLAQGRVIIEPPFMPPRPGPGQTALTLKVLRVTTEITDGVAVTQVEQQFQNPFPRQIEGTYLFPLPDGVAVGDFSMTVDGKTLAGEVLDAEQARRIYEEIVRKARDPGLLEFVGARLFRARVFPIPPNAPVAIKLAYSQALEEQGGLGLFRHPLKQDAAAPAVEQVAVTVRLKSTLPLTTVFCPSHECSVTRPDDHQATVGYEAARVQPDRDFVVYYQRKDAAYGVALLTHRAAAQDGTFLLRIAPRVELAAGDVQPKDIVFVLDTSGSMQGDKLAQARRALKFCINSLGAQDRFNILAFSTDVRPFREQLVPADGEVRQAALRYADEMQALGGTNINQALLDALDDHPADAGRVFLVVFITDGQPTVDVTDPEQIRRNVLAKNSAQTRLHVFGVGSDVNTHLLDKLAEATRGARDYCTEREDLELKLSAFAGRLTAPLLTDLKLAIEGVQAEDIYPRTLPDLFHGNDLVVLGRYKGDSTARIRLTGQARGGAQTIEYSGEFPQLATGNEFLPRLWANRKVAYLLDELRLHGANKELVDEVTRLAKRYGIVTPYTSALIVEENAVAPGALRPPPGKPAAPLAAGAAGGGIRMGREFAGKEAVADSVRLRQGMQAESLVTEAEDESGGGGQGMRAALRRVADKAFILRDARWTDTAWDGERKPRQVVAFSDEYFALLRQHPELKQFFALGERVLVVVGDEVIETVTAEPTTNEAAHRSKL